MKSVNVVPPTSFFFFKVIEKNNFAFSNTEQFFSSEQALTGCPKKLSSDSTCLETASDPTD